MPILDDLRSRGLLIKDQHPQDRRRHAVRLSPSGRAKLSRLREVGARAESELLQRLTVTERKQLHRLLAKLL